MEQDAFETGTEFSKNFEMKAEPEKAKEPENRPWTAMGFIKNMYSNETAVGAAQLTETVAEKLRDFAMAVAKRFISFSKQAVEIAVSKFVVELCAMIIAAVGALMVERHKKPVDITTAGVFYSGGPGSSSGPATTTQTQPNRPPQDMWSGSPFDNGWSRGPAGNW